MFMVLADIGVFGGPPAEPPDHVVESIDEESVVVLIERTGFIELIPARWNGERWERSGEGMVAEPLPGGEDPVVRRLWVSADDGFSSDAVALIGNVGSGLINQLDLTIDGEKQRVSVSKPIFILFFPPGTEIEDGFRAVDAGTTVLGAGTIED